MDISSIESGFINTFSLSYSVAKDVFGVEPFDAPTKVQRKIRKWIYKTYLLGTSLTESVQKFTDKSVSDFDFIAFVKACFDFEQAESIKKKQLFEAAAADLSQDVKQALWSMLQGQLCYGNIHKAEDDVWLDLSFGTNYDSTLHFIGASGLPKSDYDCFYLMGNLAKENGIYKLCGEVEYFEDESTKSFTLEFVDAEIKINLYNAVNCAAVSDPWHYLCSIASVLLDKNHLPYKYLNDKEKDLLPLAKEIHKLCYWLYIPEKYDAFSFDVLKKYIEKHGYAEVLLLLEKLEKRVAHGKSYENLLRKIASTLNKQKYEPLWRELYGLFIDSQAEYPSRAEILCPKELLIKTRDDTQKLMEQQGFSGKYPDFQKCISLQGLRLQDSYDKSYFIPNEKTVICRIKCIENYYDNYLNVQFVCTTEFVRDNKPAKDIYSCLFDCGGKRLFSTVRYDSENVYDEEETPDLAQIVEIATKTAELKKLTRQERSHIMNPNFPSWKLFCLIFIVLGGLFGVFMTIGFMLIELLVALIFGEIHEFPSLFMSTPWWMILAFCWASFGGIMGVISVIAKLK